MWDTNGIKISEKEERTCLKYSIKLSLISISICCEYGIVLGAQEKELLIELTLYWVGNFYDGATLQQIWKQDICGHYLIGLWNIRKEMLYSEN